MTLDDIQFAVITRMTAMVAERDRRIVEISDRIAALEVQLERFGVAAGPAPAAPMHPALDPRQAQFEMGAAWAVVTVTFSCAWCSAEQDVKTGPIPVRHRWFRDDGGGMVAVQTDVPVGHFDGGVWVHNGDFGWVCPECQEDEADLDAGCAAMAAEDGPIPEVKP